MKTFPLELAYVGFNSLQPYLDMPMEYGSTNKIGTLIEYKPGEFGLVAGLNVNELVLRKIEDLQLTAVDKGERIELEPVMICAKTRLIILKSKTPGVFHRFHEQAVKLANDFEVKDSEDVNLFQKDLRSQKDVITTLKAKRFRFDGQFCFSLSQNVEVENGLSKPGPILNNEGKLIAYMINAADKYVVSVFHIQYMMRLLLTDSQSLYIHYPHIKFELMDLTSDNYHLYLPEEAVAKEKQSYGCSIQDCPSYAGYPFRRGDILIEINGATIECQHIKHPTLGNISIAAIGLLTEADKLSFTLYRDRQRCEIEVDKKLFSQPINHMKSDGKFAIVNSIVFQVANSHLYLQLVTQSNILHIPNLKPENSHSLGKSYRFPKHEDSETILITETLTNNTLFSADGRPFNVAPTVPFVLKKVDGMPIRNLGMLIDLMTKIPVGSHYDLEGTMGDGTVRAHGIKMSDEENDEVLATKSITRRFSDSVQWSAMKESLSALSLLNTDPAKRSATCLYRYESRSIPECKREVTEARTNHFSIEEASKYSVLFLHATIRARSYTNPLQYGIDSNGTGSGFIIRYENKNYIITCAHVLGYTVETQLKANFPMQSKDFELQILMLNNEHDIAVLQVHPDLQKEFDEIAYPLSLDSASLFPKLQSKIAVIGFPGAAAGDKTNSKIQIGQVTTIGYLERNKLVIQYNAATSGGNSGGPVIDMNTGAVIGIHSMGSRAAQLSNFSRPVIFLNKMLKQMHHGDAVHSPYPALPGVPFDLMLITDRKLKQAHGLEPDCLIGAKICALNGNISGLEIGDILLELIDKEQRIYPVSGKGTISIEGNDISCRLFFELQEIGDPISINVMRNGKECIIHTHVDSTWPLHTKISSVRKDNNDAPVIIFSEKLMLCNFDEGVIQSIPSTSSGLSPSLVYYASKLQKQRRDESTKVAILEILPGALKELSGIKKNNKELLFLNKINGTPIRSLDDVCKFVNDSETKIFELECKSSKCIRPEQKFIFRISNTNYTKRTDIVEKIAESRTNPRLGA
ncbi:trypsin-like peptidase domain-containing protein [Candidatus Berkiella aquae]|uniref:Putative serine protease HhoB n=1 Tax=Candidatus Berkiella aquae TaxID=295108 RepID=A0A0Q9YLJ2_9GAMM|nr:S1C family serine protease [Candidatus Berkiella aquae]MCS5711513.1 S1C family serine protease [Candidatus Berkiella aquae]